MIVAGVMSGTSADGVDVAVVRLRGLGSYLHLDFLGYHHFDYPAALRKAVLAAVNAGKTNVADVVRLNFLLGDFYAEAVRRAQKKIRAPILDLVGCHGQTIYHQGDPALYLGKRIACTWQTGEGAVVAGRLGLPVVSDFRPADMAAGGKGAPLVPFLDYALFRDKNAGRVVQNIGGIANLTAIPAGSRPANVIAFDTGPGNMVIDQLMQDLFKQPYDRNGMVARRGTVIDAVLREALRAPYFRQKPPKTAGREEFGREYAEQFLRKCGNAAKADVIATVTALTARSIAASIKRFVPSGGRFGLVIVSGGGTRNKTLMSMLEEDIAGLGLKLRHSDDFGVPSQAKEAVAFALLAYQTWHRQPGNIPSATGAKKAVVLGKISYA